MKTCLVLGCLLGLTVRVCPAQKINYSAVVNPPAMTVSASPAFASPYVSVALTPVAKATVHVDYTVFMFLFGFGMVKNNVKGDIDNLLDNIRGYAATNLFSGGTPESRYKAAEQLVAQIMRLNTRIVVNGQDLTYMKTWQFAQDILLFRSIFYDTFQSTIYVQDTPDSGIPFQFISNYPLSIVNGQRNPIVVDNTKSIRIK